MYYCRKMVICGNSIYAYNYGKIQKRGFKRIKKNLGMPVKKKDPEQLEIFKELEKRKERVNFSLKRTRTRIYWIITANPDMDKFVTLTFKENILDIKKANRLFSLFIERLNYKYPDTKHFAVIEFQTKRGLKNNDGGTVHYHFLCNLPYIDVNLLAKIWGHGFVEIHKIKHVKSVGAYVSKYLNKEAFEGRMFHKRKYFYSKNLNLPLEIYDYKIQDKLISQYNLDCEESTFKEIYENIYTGKVKFKQFEISGEKRTDLILSANSAKL
jgi:hypothetical protein